MGVGKSVRNVLGQLKNSGNLIGSFPSESNGLRNAARPAAAEYMVTENYHRPHLLEFRSYNPTLTRSDFIGLLPQSKFRVAGKTDESDVNFDVLKVRDPKYFQFKDKYQLIFPDQKNMKKFARSVAYSRIEGARAEFTPSTLRHPELRCAKYVRNLEAAFESGSRYFELLKTAKDPVHKLESSLETLRQTAAPLEAKSLLVWNFPADMPPYKVMDRFWLYDIKHCFKLYWDVATGRTLTFMAFNSEEDCVSFSRNFHGVFFRDTDDCRLLVEALT
ncbi:LAFA_0E02696g1_1 [Lachancea sp. 'fantastica']|nr:LAFA_0E02696g1_1 [Lachancea sp. 'fantastica']